MDSQQNLSRRTLGKGAAWAVPAVALASAAPARAASGDCVPSADNVTQYGTVSGMVGGGSNINGLPYFEAQNDLPTGSFDLTVSDADVPASPQNPLVIPISILIGIPNDIPTTYTDSDLGTAEFSFPGGLPAGVDPIQGTGWTTTTMSDGSTGYLWEGTLTVTQPLTAGTTFTIDYTITGMSDALLADNSVSPSGEAWTFDAGVGDASATAPTVVYELNQDGPCTSTEVTIPPPRELKIRG